jgi:hypothetical protein
MKITDYLAEPKPKIKKIELIYCLQAYPSERIKDTDGNLVPYFAELNRTTPQPGTTELRRIGKILWGDAQEVFDIIQDFRTTGDYGCLWLGRWNDGVI